MEAFLSAFSILAFAIFAASFVQEILDGLEKRAKSKEKQEPPIQVCIYNIYGVFKPQPSERPLIGPRHPSQKVSSGHP